MNENDKNYIIDAVLEFVISKDEKELHVTEIKERFIKKIEQFNQQIESNHLKIESQLCIIESLTQEREDLLDEISEKDYILEKRYKALELAREALKEALRRNNKIGVAESISDALEAIEEALK